MARRKTILTNEHPYHVVARNNNAEDYHAPLSYCYGIYTNLLYKGIERWNIEVHAFVLMSNHFHLMVSTPDANISDFLRHFMTQSSKAIAKYSHRTNHMYGASNYKSLITHPIYYSNCLKYILRNPVKAGVCSKAEAYHWSSHSLRESQLARLITRPKTGHDLYLPNSKSRLYAWCNNQPPEYWDSAIENGLRGSVFQPRLPYKEKRRRGTPEVNELMIKEGLAGIETDSNGRVRSAAIITA
tara:strand:+ start:113 stop:838 length:726 start_codon:yes stop_codon:yes gene_type:complete